MPISSCDDDRLKFAQQMKDIVAEGRKLVDSGNFADGLERFLVAYDSITGGPNSKRILILHEIVSLGRSYPPALAVLKDRRDKAESLILKGEFDSEIVGEWQYITTSLGESERLLEVLHELEKRGIADDSTRDGIVSACYRYYLRKKDYGALSSHFDHFGGRFLHSILMYEFEKLFSVGVSAEYFLLDKISSYGTDLFELALGLRKDFQADEIGKRVIANCKNFDSAKMLIEAAVRADREDKIPDLLECARLQLSGSDYDKLQQIAD